MCFARRRDKQIAKKIHTFRSRRIEWWVMFRCYILHHFNIISMKIFKRRKNLTKLKHVTYNYLFSIIYKYCDRANRVTVFFFNFRILFQEFYWIIVSRLLYLITPRLFLFSKSSVTIAHIVVWVFLKIRED
jgi:hypothetical protein